MSLKQNSVHLIFCVAAGVLGCGRNLSMESGTGGGGGVPAETTGSGAGGGPSCPNLEVNRLSACWDGSLRKINDNDGYVASELSFVGAVEPDESYCVQGFPYPARANWTDTTASPVAWEFEDAVGDRLVVQFFIEGVTPDVLQPGDIVNLRVRAHYFIHAYPAGAVWLENDGVPIGVFFNLLPEFEAVPDFAIESDHAMCADQEGTYCGVARAMRVTANGESGVVPFAASALVGGLTVFNATYLDNRDCAEVGDWQVYRPQFEMALYAARGPEE